MGFSLCLSCFCWERERECINGHRWRACSSCHKSIKKCKDNPLWRTLRGDLLYFWLRTINEFHNPADDVRGLFFAPETQFHRLSSPLLLWRLLAHFYSGRTQSCTCERVPSICLVRKWHTFFFSLSTGFVLPPFSYRCFFFSCCWSLGQQPLDDWPPCILLMNTDYFLGCIVSYVELAPR